MRETARGIYLLPNLLTTTALFGGFYAVIQTLNMHFDTAAMSIFVAMIADGLDGRVARLTNTQSAFGAEYDSLSDMLSFGVAPAFLGFNWGLSTLGNIGWFIAFSYVAATALRLARFNTQVGIADKRYFQGLPCPAAAAGIAGFIWMIQSYHYAISKSVISLLALITFLNALLMVSRIRYHSFKQFNWQARVPFVSLLLLVLIFLFISIEPPSVLFFIFISFSVSGPIMTLWRLRMLKNMSITKKILKLK